MSILPHRRTQSLALACHLAAREINVCRWHGHGLYMLSFGDGGPVSEPAYYHLAMFRSRRARLRRPLGLLDISGVGTTLRESIVEEFANSSGPWKTVAFATVRAALSQKEAA
ncbi:hypothetical protein [Halomonas sp. B23F22_10]|uniref:hypothetical protein n=1 Tax=Halomonas sp. B23F22_10 TaxID=3459515 RepID=UPI00373E0DC6